MFRLSWHVLRNRDSSTHGSTTQERDEAEKQFFSRETTYPILANVDIGHTDLMLAVPLNGLARLGSDNDAFEVLEAAVE
jgi:muramoyltetrapeptide carboxypeptidase LdcA involved in peptidoglycan recycling